MVGRLVYLLTLVPYFVFSQSSTEVDSLSGWKTLQEVEVNALSISSCQFDYAGMIGVVDNQQLSLSDPSIATNLINSVPGVYWHSGALNTNRITIRGVGSRSPFSTNKIRSYYEEIPLTDGGGETTLEDIDLAFVGGIEIQKGANSSLYGSGLGGTVFLKKLSGDEEYVRLNTSVGPFGFLKSGLLGNFQAGDLQVRTGYQRQSSDGYRDNNSFDRETFFSDISYQKGKTKLDFLGVFLKQKAFIPSSLGITDFTESPTNAAFTWGSAQGFEDYDRWLVGLTLEQELTTNARFISTIYSIGRDAYEPRPFNILAEKNSGFGVRSRYERIQERWSFNAGIEAYADTYEFSTFENLYQTNNGNGSLQGSQLSRGEQPRSYVNLFAESKFDWDKTVLSLGLNANKTIYKQQNILPDVLDEKKSFDMILSPRVSLSYELSSASNLFATLSHGFSPPSVDDSANPDGSFNTDIQPEIGWNREVGWKRVGTKSNLQLALYSMSIQDLLVRRRSAEDVVFGVNAGKTLHNGIEASYEHLILVAKNTEVVGSLNYSYSNFEFKDFMDDGNDFSGNELTGVPKNQWSASIAHQTDWVFSGLSYQFVDAMPIRDDNTIFSESYQLVSVYAGANFSIGDRWSGTVMMRVNNLLDESYASMLSINARAFGSAEPRYFYPGLPRHYQVSASLSYRL